MNVKLIARRTGYGTSLATVAGTAAYASYGHMKDVALLAHQPAALAAVLPLSVDGMMVVATLAIAEDKAQGRKPRTWARIALALGAVVSVAANITATAAHFGDPLSIAVSAWPPVALFVVVEIMSKRGKLLPVPVLPAPVAPAQVVPVAAPVTPAPATPAAPVLPVPVAPPAVPAPVVQAQQVVRQTTANLPIPVSPAPAGRRERVMVSPLTGRVLMDERPKA